MTDPSIRRGGAFVVEPASAEGFLEVLGRREDEHAARASAGGAWSPDPLPRRAVFVGRLYERRGSSTGFPLVRRWVVAAFAYGDDVVRHRRLVSDEIEFPSEHYGQREHPAKRQDGAYDETRAEIEAWLRSRGKGLPVLEGVLCVPGFAEEG